MHKWRGAYQASKMHRYITMVIINIIIIMITVSRMQFTFQIATTIIIIMIIIITMSPFCCLLYSILFYT